MSDSVRPHGLQPTRLPRPWDSPGKNTGVGCHFLLQCSEVKSESEVPQSCPTFSDPMDCSLPGSSIHGIFQARVLEWGSIAFSKKGTYPGPNRKTECLGQGHGCLEMQARAERRSPSARQCVLLKAKTRLAGIHGCLLCRGPSAAAAGPPRPLVEV